MFAIIGIITVLFCVIGGYLMEHGNLAVLFQPVEFMIIAGGATGALLIASPKHVLFGIARNFKGIFTGSAISKSAYLELLALLSLILSKIRKDGLISIEADIENPTKSAIFTKFKSVLNNKHALEFLCDNLKVIITANMPPHELDSLMDIDIEAHHHEEMTPATSLGTTADGLPGLGIVAAVMGIKRACARGWSSQKFPGWPCGGHRPDRVILLHVGSSPG